MIRMGLLQRQDPKSYRLQRWDWKARYQNVRSGGDLWEDAEVSKIRIDYLQPLLVRERHLERGNNLLVFVKTHNAQARTCNDHTPMQGILRDRGGG